MQKHYLSVNFESEVLAKFNKAHKRSKFKKKTKSEFLTEIINNYETHGKQRL